MLLRGLSARLIAPCALALIVVAGACVTPATKPVPEPAATSQPSPPSGDSDREKPSASSVDGSTSDRQPPQRDEASATSASAASAPPRPLTLVRSPLSIEDISTDRWQQTSGPPGGNVSAIAVDLAIPSIVYAGLGEAGVYRSTDGGEHWEPTSIQRSPWIRAVAATRQAVFVASHSLLRSTDHGLTWAEVKVGADSRVDLVHSSPNGNGLILASSEDGRVFVSQDDGGAWREASGDLPPDAISSMAASGSEEYWVGHRNQKDGGLYHTTDGGAHWKRASVPQPPDSDVFGILVAADDPKMVVVGFGDAHNEGPRPGQDYLHVTRDGGESWQPVRYPFDPRSGGIPLTQGSDGTIYLNEANRLYRSTDRAETWTHLDLGLPKGMRPGDFGSMVVDPVDPATLYLAVLNGVLKSTDGGMTWALKNAGMILTSVSLLAAHPTDPGTVFAASAGGEGTFVSADYGEHWTWLNDRGLPHPWADELVVDPVDTDTVYEIVDIADVYRSGDGGAAWDRVWQEFRFSSVYALAVAPSDPAVIYALKNGFGIFKSTDGGEGWEFQHQSGIDYTYTLAVDPDDADIVFSGYNPKPFQDWAMVRRSVDGGASWETVLEVPGSSGITSVSIDPGNSRTVYAGSAGSGGAIWASYDGGSNWQALNESFNFVNVHALTADPGQPLVAYAGVWGGGTFKTSDGGRSWDRLLNDPTISASAILVDPGDSDTIYLADRTGPRVYRTSNAGASWEVYFDAGPEYYRVMTATLAQGNPDVLYVSLFSRAGPMSPSFGDLFRVERGEASKVTGELPRLPVVLAVDPEDDGVVYAILHIGGVYGSSDAGASWVELSGSGSGLPPSAGFNGLLLDPRDTDTLYLVGGCDIGLDLRSRGVDPALLNTVYRSTDRGKTWVSLNDGTLGENSGQVKSVTVAQDGTFYAATATGVLMSTDDGASWQDLPGLRYRTTAGVALSSDGRRLYAPTLGGGVYAGDVNAATGGVTWDNHSNLIAKIRHVQVTVHPANSETIFASAYPGGVFKSTDGGATWIECNFGMASFQIDDPSRQGYYALAVAPSQPDVVYLGLYGVGVYKSSDGAGTWQPVNGADGTMRGRPLTTLVVDPDDAHLAYAATEGGVFRTTNGGLTWTDWGNGLTHPDIRTLALSETGTLYAGSKGYGVYRSDSSAASWRQLPKLGNFGTFWPIWDGRPLYQYTSLLIDPTNGRKMYIGTFPAGIYKSADGGATWKEHNVGWTNDGVFSLVFHPEDMDTIYAGTYNGINRSTDGGEHWELWDNGWPPEQWVFSVVFDPTDSNVMYACSKNGEDMGRGREGFHGTVMKTIDGGANWFEITNGLNVDQEFYEIVIDPVSPDTLYLATMGEGIFISRNAGDSWASWNEGLTNLMAGTNGNNVTNILALSADGHVLYFGTNGSGVWRRRLERP